MGQRIPLAWKQLAFERMKLVAAVAGVMVSVLLMLVQLGILQSVYHSATAFHRGVRADLVVISPLSTNLTGLQPFSTRTLHRALGHAGVERVAEIHSGIVEFKNPWNGDVRRIACYGLDPLDDLVELEGLAEHRRDLLVADTFLFDRNSKRSFGPIARTLAETGDPVRVEVSRREAHAIGTTALGVSFGVDGNLVTDRANFLRLLPNRDPHLIELGLIRLKPQADPERVRDDLTALFGSQVEILTLPQFIDWEIAYWNRNAPVGFVFTMGTIVGFFIGFIVVYQILFTEVTNHLPHFATMKAMGFGDRFLLGIVMRQGLILALLGFFPGLLLAIVVYSVMRYVTQIPIEMTTARAIGIFVLTLLMCLLSGAVTVRKLRDADPADVF